MLTIISFISIFKLYCRRLFSLFMNACSVRVSFWMFYSFISDNAELEECDNIKSCTCDVLEEIDVINISIIIEEIEIKILDACCDLIIMLCADNVDDWAKIMLISLIINAKASTFFFISIKNSWNISLNCVTLFSKHLYSDDDFDDLMLLLNDVWKIADELKTVST